MSAEAMLWAKRARTGSASRKVVLLVLADYADEAGECFPGQATIAEQAELGVRTVRRVLAELESAGLLSRTERRRDDGYRTSDRIRLRLDVSPAALAARSGQAEPISPANHDSLTGQPRPISPARAAGQEPKVGTASRTASSPPTPSRPEPDRQPSLLDRPAAAAPAPATYASASHDLAFERFWAVYPRRVGKVAARKAWRAALRRAPDAVIVSGAERYRDDPNREDEFTAHPTTWLNQGRWDDDPLPERTSRRNRTEQAISRMAGGRPVPRPDFGAVFGDTHPDDRKALGA